MPTEDISGDGVVDYRDMSFGEGGRRDVPMSERVVNGLLGGPLRAVDFVQGSLFDMSGAGDPSMSQAESVSQMNEANARYAARLQADRQRALDVALAQQEQEDLIAAGLIENPISNAVTTPYVAPVVRSTVNSGGNGTGAEQRAGGSKVGGVNRGTNAFSGM